MDEDERIRQLLREVMDLCDEQQNWGIKKFARMTLGAMVLTKDVQERLSKACEKTFEEVYVQIGYEEKTR